MIFKTSSVLKIWAVENLRLGGRIRFSPKIFSIPVFSILSSILLLSVFIEGKIKTLSLIFFIYSEKVIFIIVLKIFDVYEMIPFFDIKDLEVNDLNSSKLL